MNADESDIYRAAKAYVEAAIQLLAELYPEIDQQPIKGLQEWTCHSRGLWVLGDMPSWHPLRFGIENLNKPHALSEHAAFAKALQADPVIASQLNTLVGTRGTARAVGVDEATDRLVWMMIERLGQVKFDGAVFDELFEQFLSAFSRSAFAFQAIAPLPMFKTETFPIDLGQGTTIDRLTDQEVKRCLQINLFHFMSLNAMAHVDAEFGVRVIYPVDKRVGDVSEPPDRWLAVMGAAENRVREVLHALHLFKPGQLSHAGIVHFSDQWPIEGGTSRSGSRQNFGSGIGIFQLKASETTEFRTLWDDFEHARDFKFIDLAIRRFGYAGERSRPEDRLIDLMIAAESLFLSDTSGELGFRLALRFAYYVDTLRWSRPERFKQMRDAYNARSTLVHGSEPDPNRFTLPGEGPVPLEKFVDALEQSLRLALVKALSTFPPHRNNQLVDWDALILS
jgi:hypothetical protein